jgi:hypothetical protein
MKLMRAPQGAFWPADTLPPSLLFLANMQRLYLDSSRFSFVAWVTLAGEQSQSPACYSRDSFSHLS